jgi:hypothetical protein
MTETIKVVVPRRSIGSDLSEALSARGLQAKVVEGDSGCALHVSFGDGERERLVAEATHAIESYLSEQMLPLVVHRADGGCVVRPPAD